MKYPDYVETESGLQYKVMQHVVKCKCFSVKKALFLTSSINKLQDLRPGNGPKPKKGETVVVRHWIIFAIDFIVNWSEVWSFDYNNLYILIYWF